MPTYWYWFVTHCAFVQLGWAYRTQVCVNVNISTTNNVLPISSDEEFIDFIGKNSLWIDTSELIYILRYSSLAEEGKALVVDAPPRTGKTTNLKMLKFFLQIPVNENGECIKLAKAASYRYFGKGEIHRRDGLVHKTNVLPVLSEYQEYIQRDLGRYPVIYLDFSGMRENAEENLKQTVRRAFEEHKYLRKIWLNVTENIFFTSEEKRDSKKMLNLFDTYLNGESDVGGALMKSINYLARWLFEYYDRRVIILIDEYDRFAENQKSKKRMEILMGCFAMETLLRNDIIEKGIFTGSGHYSKGSYKPVTLFRENEIAWSYDTKRVKHLQPFFQQFGNLSAG